MIGAVRFVVAVMGKDVEQVVGFGLSFRSTLVLGLILYAVDNAL